MKHTVANFKPDAPNDDWHEVFSQALDHLQEMENELKQRLIDVRHHAFSVGDWPYELGRNHGRQEAILEVLGATKLPKVCQACSIRNHLQCWKAEHGNCDLLEPNERFQSVVDEEKVDQK